MFNPLLHWIFRSPSGLAAGRAEYKYPDCDVSLPLSPILVTSVPQVSQHPNSTIRYTYIQYLAGYYPEKNTRMSKHEKTADGKDVVGKETAANVR